MVFRSILDLFFSTFIRFSRAFEPNVLILHLAKNITATNEKVLFEVIGRALAVKCHIGQDALVKYCVQLQIRCTRSEITLIKTAKLVVS